MKNNHSHRLVIKKAEIDKVELRSEEVRAILGAPPTWTIRSGATYLLIIIVLLLSTSWFVRYPDIIYSSVTLTSEAPPVSVVTASPGYLSLWVQDKDSVQKGQYIGFTGEQAIIESVMKLKKELISFKKQFVNSEQFLQHYTISDTLILEDLQDPYNGFLQAIYQYQVVDQQMSFQQKIQALETQKKGYVKLNKQLRERNYYKEEQLKMVKESVKIDSILFSSGALSEADLNTKKQQYLREIENYKNAVMNITNNEITKADLEEKIQDLQLQKKNEQLNRRNTVASALKLLLSKVALWEQKHMIKAPVSGQVVLFSGHMEYRYLNGGEEVLTIISNNHQYFCRASIPVAGSGKIQIGQSVNIKLDNYPYQQFGTLRGEVTGISPVPKEDEYNLIISLPEGIISSYGKPLLFGHEMTGQAEVITADLRLFERFFHELRLILDRSPDKE